jgi:hypothetical protein
MSPTQHLFHLVNGLNRAEKTYFREFAKRRNKTGATRFLQLFDLIDRSEVYDEDKFAAAIGVASFPSLKMRLFDLVIEALQERESYGSKPSEISSYLQQVEILHKKGLRAPMWKRIAKLEEMCSHVEDFQTWKLVLQKRQYLALEEVEPGFIPPQMEGFFDLYAGVKQKAANLEAYKDLEDLADLSRCLGAKAMYDNALGLASNPLMQPGALRLSIRAEIKYCDLLRNVYRLTDRHLEARTCSMRITELLDGNPQFKQDAHLQLLYAKQVSNIGLYQAATRDLAGAQSAIDRLAALGDYPHVIFERVHAIELQMAIQNLDLAAGRRVIAAIAEGLKRHDHKMSHARKIAYNFLAAHFLLCFDQAGDALKWVLQLRGFDRPGVHKDLQDFGEILFLLCHFDRGNFDVVKTEATKIKAYLTKCGAISAFEMAVIDGLLAAAKARGTQARLAQLAEMEPVIAGILDLQQYNFRGNYFPIKSWLVAKRTGRLPMEVELQEQLPFS